MTDNNKFRQLASGISTALLALSLTAAPVAMGGTGPDISGSWQSEKAENAGNGSFGWREFDITDDSWEVRFTMYGDEGKTLPVFRFRGVGPYEIQAASAVVAGANDAIFRFSHKYVTLLTDHAETIAKLGFSACGLEPGVEMDISDTGCSFLVSVQACAQEYDLVKVENGRFYLGARPADGNMCTEERRPTSLNLPLVPASGA